MNDETRQQKLAEARKKYGKKFSHEIGVPRLTKPSLILIDIKMRSCESAIGKNNERIRVLANGRIGGRTK